MKGIEEQRENICKNYFVARQQDDGMVELSCRMRPEQISLLHSILFETDYSRFDILEEKIYAFGKTIRTKDGLGKDLFVFLASIIRGVNT